MPCHQALWTLYWPQLLNLRKHSFQIYFFLKENEEVGKNKINVNIFYWLDQRLEALDEALPFGFFRCPAPILSNSVVRKDDGLRALKPRKQSAFPTVDLIALQRSSVSSPWKIYTKFNVTGIFFNFTLYLAKRRDLKGFLVFLICRNSSREP